MAELYAQIAVVVTGNILDTNPFDLPVRIVEFIRRKIGFVKQPAARKRLISASKRAAYFFPFFMFFILLF